MHFINKTKIIQKICSRMKVNDRIWVFGAWLGEQYSDNTKALFEYVNAHRPDMKPVWITKNKKVLRKVRKSGYKCYLERSLPGVYYAVKAGAAFMTEGERDISRFVNYQKTLPVQLWHGMGFKAMKWDDNSIAKQQERFSSYKWMAPSQLYVDTFMKLLKIPAYPFSITGYPRNDTFISKPENENMERLRRLHPDKKFMIYMPTHRNFGSEGNRYINLDELKRLDGSLKERKIIMVYKPHFHELKNFIRYEESFSNIILAKDDEIWSDVYAYLHYFDVLVSDYSSVITDFMCSGKPVVYFPYDIEDYQKDDAGLNDYFWTIPGGPMCYTWEEVLNTVSAILSHDAFREERERCRKLYHVYNDGNNCRRVCEAVENFLAERAKK